MDKIAAPEPHAENKLEVTVIKPFENIALAFSGGGFRAAAFALGVLSYLDKVKFVDEADELNGHSLLQQVTYISSASGGTITAAKYALYNAQGKSFGTFYSDLLLQLTGDDLLRKALEMLAYKKYWKNRDEKSRNIINAFSLAYNSTLFDGFTLGALAHDGAPGKHLQEVCFNATEFYTGQSFRQAIKVAPDSKPDKYFTYGNMVIYLEKDAAAKIKLGDILAASSCFPAGFEPIVFPNDFTHDNLKPDELKQALTMVPQTGEKQEQEFIAKKHFGLMDGGVTDNQGLQSMMYADGRRIRNETDFKYFDLMLVNDVGSHYIQPYVMPVMQKGWELSLRGLSYIAIAALLLFAGTIFFGIHCHYSWATVVGSLLITVPVVFLGGLYFARRALFGAPNSTNGLRKNFTEQIIKLLTSYFSKTPLSVIKQMISARAESVLMLNMSIFLKRIRQLLYDKFYFSPQWQNRGKGNHIYDLSFSNNINRKWSQRNDPPERPALTPSKDMQIVAQVAFDMGTTLWFDKQNTQQQHSEACIIACGQFTTCYNLLQYIDRLLDKAPADKPYDAKYETRLHKLKAQMQADFDKFRSNPFFYYNESGKEFKIAGFEEVLMKEIPCPEGLGD